MNTNNIYINQSVDSTSFTIVISNDEVPLTKESIASTLLEVTQHLTQGDNDEGRQQSNLPGILPEEGKLLHFTGTEKAGDTGVSQPVFTEWYDKGNGAV